MDNFGTSLRELCWERQGKRMRESSYDRTGGNFDFYMIQPWAKRDIFNIACAGCITHIWATMNSPQMKPNCYERKLVVRMFWDGEGSPSVEAPIGDFFGMGHGISKNFVSAPLSMCPQDGKGYNCYFAMPFNGGARIEIENQSDDRIMFYFYVDYEQYETPNQTPLRFHARWHRQLTEGADETTMTGVQYQMAGRNPDGKNNYVVLEAEGKGHYVGCNMNIHNLRFTNQFNWPGEGDDMIFIDGEPWPPRLHGTGTEDYFNTAYCPTQEFNTPYSGIILPGGPNWFGKITYYRYHIQDPVMFEKSIKVTMEHGHNNHRSDDYSSTAYWYQSEPHMQYPPIAPVQERMPLDDIVFDYDELRAMFMKNGRGNGGPGKP